MDRSHSEVLSNWTEIIENVFKHLPAQSLNTCARVCKKWYEVATRIHQSRKQLNWFMYGWHRDDPNKPSEDELDATIFSQLVTEKLKLTASEPHTALLFCSSGADTFANEVIKPGRNRKSKKSRQSTLQFLSGKLPSNCPLFGVVAASAVGTHSNITSSLSVIGPSIEAEDGPGISCLLFPKRDDFTMHHFLLYKTQELNVLKDDKEMLKDDKEMLREQLSHITGISPHENIKLLLFFCMDFDAPFDLPRVMWQSYDNIVIAGGYVDSCSYPEPHTEEQEPVSLGIALTGENLRVSSTIIPTAVDDPKEVIRILEEMKASGVPVQNSVAFMFACIGRGYYHYLKSNVEADAFRKVFPSIPLFGFFGNGEIGHKFPQTTNKEPRFYHSYTTIFTVVSFGQ